MIDGLIKTKIDPLWEAMATPLVRARMTPNQVTFTGLILVTLVSGLYLWHGLPLVYGLTLALSFVFDALDGAVARRRNMRSRRGGYFDAMVDRYQELIVLATLGYMHNAWPLALFALSGSLFTSYAKARTAIETPVHNDNWPDFFERMERVIFLCVMLVLAGALPAHSARIATYGLALFALLAHVTALQRARRASQMLGAIDRDRK
ncbi:MAG: CDP-alcohol phosphatidyltransferase family protein [Pseudopelagicola sp.]|nr:CDP-alcohol phosphatidyltransferase family protein [Pseudopelagicola sp.]